MAFTYGSMANVKKPKHDLGDFGGDEATEPSGPLSWRDDPKTSLSDFTITIKPEESVGEKRKAKMEVYHVHKTVLGIGKRASQYFARLFQNNALRENEDSASTLTMLPSACRCFPMFLDFVYTGGPTTSRS